MLHARPAHVILPLFVLLSGYRASRADGRLERRGSCG
jgi:hypothetical protein